MKKLITIILIGLALNSNSQDLSFDIGGGYVHQTKNAIAELDMTYERGIVAKLSMITNLSNNIDGGALFNGRIGYDFKIGNGYSIQPLVGYGYLLRSNDEKSLNVGTVIGSLYLIKTLKEYFKIGVGTNYLTKIKNNITTVTFIFVLN